MLKGVWAGDRVGVLAGVNFFFAGDSAMGGFLKVVILEGVRFSHFTTGGGVIECCLTLGEDDADDEWLILRADCSRFAFKASFSF